MASNAPALWDNSITIAMDPDTADQLREMIESIDCPPEGLLLAGRELRQSLEDDNPDIVDTHAVCAIRDPARCRLTIHRLGGF